MHTPESMLRQFANYTRNTGRTVLVPESNKALWDSGIGEEYPTLELVPDNSHIKVLYRIRVKKA